MPKGYWVVQVDVTDPEGYKAYIAENAVAFRKFGAHFLVRGAKTEVPEGHVRQRIVVLEFPSLQAAHDCYHAPEYAAAKALRQGRSVVDLAIVGGYDGAQPGA